MKHITTGVDKLVKLVSEQKNITLEQAAKQLNVGKDTLQEWAEFLEQEGLITIKYSFSKIWLKELKINDKSALNMGKELISEKDILRRKIEVALSRLESEASALSDVKTKFSEIQSQIKGEVQSVKRDLNELERFNSLKNSLDKDIVSQKKSYEKDLESIQKELREDSDSFDKLLEQINVQTSELKLQKKELDSLTDKRNKLEKAISGAQDILDSLTSKLNEKEKLIKNIDKQLIDLESKALQFKEKISSHKEKSVIALLNKVSEDKKNILESQDKLLKDSKEVTKSIESHFSTGHKLYDDFKKFAQKKQRLESDVESILKEKEQLVKDFEKLRAKVYAFSIAKDNPNVRKNLAALQKSLESYEQRRISIRKKIDSLLSFIKG